MTDDIVQISCANPYCDKFIYITRKQKIFKLVIQPRDKGILDFMYCSKECQGAHEKMLLSRLKSIEF
jgi:hypothetical protein